MDGVTMDAVLAMRRADFEEGQKKAKAHMGLDLNRGISYKLLCGEDQAKAADSAQSTSYRKQHLKQWRARRDYFKTFLAEMPEELVELIQAVAA